MRGASLGEVDHAHTAALDRGRDVCGDVVNEGSDGPVCERVGDEVVSVASLPTDRHEEPAGTHWWPTVRAA